MQRRASLERTGQGARERNLESVKHPGNSKRQNDAGMEAAPAQRIETEGNAGLDNVTVDWWCSVQIALPLLQTHGAKPIRNCRECKASFPTIAEGPLAKTLTPVRVSGFPYSQARNPSLSCSLAQKHEDFQHGSATQIDGFAPSSQTEEHRTQNGEEIR